METKHEAFQRIATKRVTNIIKYLDLLENCSNTYTYEYTKEDIDKIFKAINSKVKGAKSIFESKLNNKKFKL